MTSKVIEFPKKRPKSTPQVVRKRNRESPAKAAYLNRTIGELLRKGEPPERIAKVLGLAIKQVTGRINAVPELRMIGFARKEKKQYSYYVSKEKPTRPPQQSIDENDPWFRIQAALGARAKRHPHGFTLDGVPCGFYAIIREANRKLKADREKQIIGSPEWVV